MNKKDIAQILFAASLGVVCFWVGYAAHDGYPDQEINIRLIPDYLTAHHCDAEDVLMVDGVEKVRYLCNAEGNNNAE